MPPRGWRKVQPDVPENCPNCDHHYSMHHGGACLACTCSGWLRLPPRNEYRVPQGWYLWGRDLMPKQA